MNPDENCAVKCDLCQMDSIVPKSLYGVKCPRINCLGIVFRPLGTEKKYVRIICKDKPYYYYINAGMKCIECSCCKAVYTVSDDVIEIKCGQKIYDCKKVAPKEDSPISLAMKLAVCEENSKKIEAELAKLKTENGTLQALHQKAKETIESEVENAKSAQKEMDRLKTENIFFHSRMEELKRNLKDSAQKNDEMKEEIDQLKKENIELISKIQEANAKNEEMKSQLEKATNERDLLMSSLNTNKELAEQVKTLMATNLNLSATMAKMTALTTQNQVEEKKEESEEQSPEQLKDGQWPVACSFCGVKGNVPHNSGVAYCENCPTKSAIILAPVQEGFKYIRWQCRHTVFYCRAPNEQKAFSCSCCMRGYRISDAAIEVRNGQRVYKATAEVLAEDELVELRKKLKNLEDQYESERKTTEENVKKAIEQIQAAEKAYQEQTKKMAFLEEENKKSSDELDILLKIKAQNENMNKEKNEAMEQKMAYLVEINTVLMKKLMGKRMAGEKNDEL